MAFIKSKFSICLLLFCLSLGLSLYSIHTHKQLNALHGMAEGYMRLGQHLHRTGTFYWEKSVPFVFRPPGYIFFVSVTAGIDSVIQKTASAIGINKKRAPKKTLKTCQAIVLALSTVFLFLWMALYFNRFVAGFMAAIFGLNPYLTIHVGLFHYGIFHIFLTVLSCYITSLALRPNIANQKLLLLAGVLWGLTTLTRPMTLILPIFILILLLVKNKLRLKPSLVLVGIFTLGMFITIAPYTVRNYVVSGFFIPINCQKGTALWSGTVKKMEANPNRFRWWHIWYPEGQAVAARITKNPHYNYSDFVKYIVPLNEEFQKEAARNIWKKPDVYLYNMWQNFISFNIHINSVFISCFEYMNTPGTKFQRHQWFSTDSKITPLTSISQKTFEGLVLLLTTACLIALIIALKKRDSALFVAGLTYGCFCLAHTITHLDLMYYYIKMPFLYFGTGYALNKLISIKKKIPGFNFYFSAFHVATTGLAGCTLFLIVHIIV